MKTLFLVFYGFQEYNGISKKIRYQADALQAMRGEMYAPATTRLATTAAGSG